MSSPFTKLLATVAIIIIIIQIVVSLIYSNLIINTNQVFNQQRQIKSSLIMKTEKLQNRLSDLESISTLLLSSPSASLQPITKYFKINE